MPLPLRPTAGAAVLAVLAAGATATMTAGASATPRAAGAPDDDVLRAVLPAATAPLGVGVPPTLAEVQAAALHAAREEVLGRLRARETRRAVARAGRVRRALTGLHRAGDRIATRPYSYGGGHGSFRAGGYDCSGSVSYALHGAGLLDRPLASGDLMSYGEPGPGKHITIYANGGHAFMVVDGRRFDTSAMSETGGSRWTRTQRSTAGYVVRHPAGF